MNTLWLMSVFFLWPAASSIRAQSFNFLFWRHRIMTLQLQTLWAFVKASLIMSLSLLWNLEGTVKERMLTAKRKMNRVWWFTPCNPSMWEAKSVAWTSSPPLDTECFRSACSIEWNSASLHSVKTHKGVNH